jgi:hypothetical protein
MKVLIACEYSGTVRDAFIAAGHDAMSCDLLPSDAPGPHYLGDVRDVLGDGWDLMIAHPPCTYLAVSGARWFHLKRGRTGRSAGLRAVFAGGSRAAHRAREPGKVIIRAGYESQIRLSSRGSTGTKPQKRRACG